MNHTPLQQTQSQPPASLVVFSDDWGRHPSSCQHLIRRLLPRYQVLWVNTIGTRTPKFDLATLRRVGEKLAQWCRPTSSASATDETHHHANLQVVNPRMWPWFSRPFDRRLNARLLTRRLTPLIDRLPKPVTAVTTLPVTADLVKQLPVQKWVYYCVDDFSEWPGLDGRTLRQMDDDMIRRADEIVAVSTHLQEQIAARSRQSELLTHGVDLAHWQCGTPEKRNSTTHPRIVFWGVVDRRLDVDALTALSRRLKTGSIELVGPQQDPDPRILALPNVVCPGPQAYDALPALAQTADVLIMPYADLPVTRAMQPLKMKEYLATGRPVVVSSLPAAAPWSDCMDIADSAAAFADFVVQRIGGEVPHLQQAARARLEAESWEHKAAIFAGFLSSRQSPCDRMSRDLTSAEPDLESHSVTVAQRVRIFFERQRSVIERQLVSGLRAMPSLGGLS